MSQDSSADIHTQVRKLITDGTLLYMQCAQEYITNSPKAVENPTEFRSQIQDLFRGLVLKVIHGVVLADQRLTEAEINLCSMVFSQLWNRPFNERNVRSILVKHGEQDPYRWEDLLWPFERLAPFKARLGEAEKIPLKLVELFKHVDGQVRDSESYYLGWLRSELQRVLHPIRIVDDETEPATKSTDTGSSKKISQQFKTAQAQAEALKPLPVPAELIDLNTLLAELDALTGLASVKRDVKELIHFLEMQKHRKAHGLPVTSISLHAIFSGNPGTGKTTVARIYGKLLGALGILKKGHLVETDRSGLVAEYAGQTAAKTNARVDESLDGVLFIDEAYSLVHEGEDPYGAEAVQTLLKRMEDQRDRLVVILAGYPEPMQQLLNTNPGLASRFGRTLTFADYSPVELCRIFNTFCQRDHYVLSASTRASLIKAFTHYWQKRDDKFGNGRLARNIFESTLRKLATRLAQLKSLSKELLCSLEPADLSLSDLPVEQITAQDTDRFEHWCVGCAKTIKIQTGHLGQTIRCPGCSHTQTVEWAGLWNESETSDKSESKA
ncbi:MAG: AAA family ATPase [Planctomycetia bacterium]|nr:AAA family ATPase [Planctomycetia bacterium]